MNLKLDTLNKKPKVYSIAVWSAAVLALLACILLFGGQRRYIAAGFALMVYFFVVAALLIRAFFLQMRYNLYSYNTIIYFGFSLLSLAVGIFCLQGSLQLMRNPEASGGTVFSQLTSSGMGFIIYSVPFLLLFSLALIISNISLIVHEGFRFVNVLGILLALMLIGGLAVIYRLDYYASGSLREVMLHDLGVNALATVYLYFECMLLGAIVAGAIAARVQPPMDRDHIIVLGCAIRRDGTPTPLLRGRLDRALEFAREQEAQTGKAPVFVLSGGQGADEAVSEARSMRDYLASRGVPENRMLLEDRSTDTAENMRFSKELIQAEDPEAKIGFSTTNYHVFRAGLKARRVKMRALGMGCKSKWYFWPNAAVREFVGLLTEHRGKQALILLGMLAAYSALTVFYYLRYA